jgi:Regulatory CLIP domain of proteinases
VKVRDCSKATDLINNKPIPSKIREYLRGSQCGYVDRTPYVCCVDGEETTEQSATEQSTTSIHQKETSLENESVEKEGADDKPEWLRTLEARLPKPPVCGHDAQDRIFGGNVTDLNEFPWTVLVEYKKREF